MTILQCSSNHCTEYKYQRYNSLFLSCSIRPPLYTFLLAYVCPQGVVVNSSLGAEVVTVVATDDDAGSNGEISYLLSGSGAGMFSINSTGLVTVAQPLDYETFPGPYVLTVIARDNGG